MRSVSNVSKVDHGGKPNYPIRDYLRFHRAYMAFSGCSGSLVVFSNSADDSCNAGKANYIKR
jgi:hypothetical protein